MAKVYEFLANGFEEVEALAPVDILRRGGVEVKTVSITGSHLVESSHGVPVKADLLIEELGNADDADLLLIPDVTAVVTRRLQIGRYRDVERVERQVVRIVVEVHGERIGSSH